MPKTFYTDRDIDDLARKGVRELEISDDVYLTDLARERAEKAGIKLRPKVGASSRPRGNPAPTAPSSPAGNLPPTGSESGRREEQSVRAAETEELVRRVKGGVLARLGPGVDAAMVETIVRRVVSQLQ